MANSLQKKKKGGEQSQVGVVRGGFKIAKPPKSAKRRKALAGEDISTSGGCRTVHRQTVQR